jgi:hypothetical protein
MQGIANLYYWTWFVWPFIFVFSLLYAISSLNDEKGLVASTFVAAISLLIILAERSRQNFSVKNIYPLMQKNVSRETFSPPRSA